MNSAQLRAALAVLGIDSGHISSRAVNSADVGLPDRASDVGGPAVELPEMPYVRPLPRTGKYRG